jgi:hypothetical protein
VNRSASCGSRPYARSHAFADGRVRARAAGPRHRGVLARSARQHRRTSGRTRRRSPRSRTYPGVLLGLSAAW